MPGYSNIRINYKVWMSNAGNLLIIDDNGWNLLCCIEELGNLKLAAKSLNISYRKAWGDLRTAENLLEIKLVEKHRGGEHGGNTILTEDGHKIVKAYKKMMAGFQESVNDTIIEFKRTLKNKI